MMAKRLELLKQIQPSLRRAGMLTPRVDPFARWTFDVMTETAKALGVELELVEASDGPGARVDGLVLTDFPLFTSASGSAAVAAVAARRGLVSAGGLSYPRNGGLLAYGVDLPHMFRRAGVFVDEILEGAKPGDIPIEQATKFTTIFNLKTAAALGVQIPPTLLAAADEVIE